ncbi:uncharacterized protein LOC107488112 [Arachis duranensis]|uniref:Uncharacterized protein LOC107488112 n=1 Tax=Arachis duranensis TaxID=130453 RepID=A0A6P4D970_ARADU|nr:uncharacterized protein LOC107488112 [Arachis duranensis]
MGNSIAKDLWQKLKNRFYQGDVFKIAELQEKLFSIKQGDLSVTHYFTKLKGIREDLETFIPLPQCNCTLKCTCVFDTVSNYRKNTFVVRFLRGLNEQFGSARSNIMLMNPLPSIDSTYSMMLQQERKLLGTDIAEPSPLLSTASSNTFQSRGRGHGRGGRGRGPGGRGSSKLCAYCGKTGHLIDTCYHKYGIPPHLKKQNQINNLTTEDDDCGEPISLYENQGESSHAKFTS